MCRRIIMGLALSLAMSTFSPRAEALFGVGDVVIDPSNLAQNILTAGNTLEQINNQIEQLQNEAQMLVNQAENLARLDHNAMEQLSKILVQIDTLIREADEITYEVAESQRRYKATFPESYEGLANDQLVIRATNQWVISQRTFGNSIRVQSGIVSAIVEGKETLESLVGKSQTASGALSVAQAGNQLVAMSVEQQMQMQHLMAAHYRMIAVEESRRAAIQEQSRLRHDRFVGGDAAYARD